MDVSIEPISELDMAAYRACLDAVAKERRYLAIAEAPEPSLVQAWIDLLRGRGLPFMVARCREAVIGWCDIGPRYVGPIARLGFDHCGILGMGIAPGHRGQGLGTRLLDAALDGAWRAGLERVELEVFASNEAALRLYRRAGFATEGRKRNARKLDGVYDDVIIMALLAEQQR